MTALNDPVAAHPDRSGESAAACPVRFRARLPSGACAREIQRPVARRLATRSADGVPRAISRRIEVNFRKALA